MSQTVNLTLEILLGSASDDTLWSTQTQFAGNVSALPLSWKDNYIMVVDTKALGASLGEATTGADLGGSSKFLIFNVQVTQAVLHQPLKHGGALHSPNGMCLYSKNPKFPMVKAVYGFEVSSIVICQKPAFNPKQEKDPVPTKLLMAFCIWGSRWESFLVLAFNLQKSM